MSSGTSTENFLLNIQAFPPRHAGNTFLRKTHFRDVILLTNCFSLSVCSNYRSLDARRLQQEFLIKSTHWKELLLTAQAAGYNELEEKCWLTSSHLWGRLNHLKCGISTAQGVGFENEWGCQTPVSTCFGGNHLMLNFPTRLWTHWKWMGVRGWSSPSWQDFKSFKMFFLCVQWEIFSGFRRNLLLWLLCTQCGFLGALLWFIHPV